MIILKGYGLIKEGFRDPTKDDIINPYISDNDFRSSLNGKDIGYILHVFDIGYHRNL